MININIGLNTTPPPQFEMKGKSGVQDQALDLLLTFDLKLSVQGQAKRVTE